MKDRALRRHQDLKAKKKVKKLIMIAFPICHSQKCKSWKTMLKN